MPGPPGSPDPGGGCQCQSPSTEAEPESKRRRTDENTPPNRAERPSRAGARPDAARRIAVNATYNFVSRKSTLRAVCTDEALSLPWEDVLKTMNRVVAEGYLLADFYVINTLASNGQLVELTKPFFRKCLAALSDPKRVGKTTAQYLETITGADSSDIHFETTVQEYVSLRGDIPAINGRYINQGFYGSAAEQMAKATRLSVTRNIGRRLRLYVFAKYNKKCGDATDIVKGAMDDVYTRRLCQSCRTKKRKKKALPPDCAVCKLNHDAATEVRRLVPRDREGKINWSTQALLPLYSTILSAVETANEKNSKKTKFQAIRTFSLVPTKQGFRCAYAHINSTGLRDLLQCSTLDRSMTVVTSSGQLVTLGESFKVWGSVAELWWRKLFRVASFEKSGLHFHCELATNGKGVSITLHRKKPEAPAETPPRRLEDYDVVWSLDPGSTDMFTAARFDVSTHTLSDEIVHYPSTKFYGDSSYRRSTKRIQRKIARASDIQTTLKNIPTKKTASLETLKEHIRYVVPKLDKLLTFFMQKTFRNLRFRRSMLADKNLKKVCYDLAGNSSQRTLVAFGNWAATNSAGIIKKKTPGSVKRLERMLAHYCDVKSTDEYLTSQMHHGCSSPERMENQRTKRRCRDNVVRSVAVHKVFHCRRRDGGCGQTVNRDVNASRNILDVALCELQYSEGARPVRLRRPSP